MRYLTKSESFLLRQKHGSPMKGWRERRFAVSIDQPPLSESTNSKVDRGLLRCRSDGSRYGTPGAGMADQREAAEIARLGDSYSGWQTSEK